MRSVPVGLISHEIMLLKVVEKTYFDNISIPMIRSFSSFSTQKFGRETICQIGLFYKNRPQGTNSGPLLFNIFGKTIHLHVTERVKNVHYANDTFISIASEDIYVEMNEI